MAIRTGVIGFGLAGRVFHAPFVNAVKELELSAIVQRTGDGAAAAYPGVQVFRSADDLFRSDVELVVIGTPNRTHVPLAKAAIAAGKHLVVDKPLAGTAAEIEELQALANKQGTLLAPFHNRRFDGDFLTVKRLIEGGTVGRAVTLLSHFDRFRPAPRANTWKEEGGAEHGLLMDLGPHLIDQALLLFGRPTQLSADVRSDRDVSAIDDAFNIVLHFDRNGKRVRVDLGSTMIAADPQPRFLLQGTGGSYRKYGVDPQEPSILAGAKVPPQGSGDDWYTEDEEAWGTLTKAPDPNDPANLKREKLPTERGDYRLFYEGVAEAIARGATPPTTAKDALRVAQIIELARESSRLGRSMTVSENF